MSVFRIRWKQLGGHIHMRVFSAPQPNYTFAKLGDLCCTKAEFHDLQLAMAGIQFIEEEPAQYPPPEPEFDK